MNQEKIKKSLIATVFLIISFLNISYIEAASTFSYQGYLSDASGPVTTPKNMRFRLYNVSSGGNFLWDSGNMNTIFNNGSFAVELNPSQNIDFNAKQYYLQIFVDNIPLSPYEKLDTVAYSHSTNGIHSATAAPTVQTAGGVYYNTTEKALYASDGTLWNELLATAQNATTTIKGNSQINGYQVISGNLTVGGVTNLASTTISGSLDTDGTVRFSHYGAGTVTTLADGTLTISSDERLKDISPNGFNRGVNAVIGINPIKYKWNAFSGLEPNHEYTGFSAQNIKAHIPEAIGEDNRGFLTLSDRPILAAVVNAIKTIWNKITGHNSRINRLEDDMRQVKQILDLSNNTTVNQVSTTEDMDVSDLETDDIQQDQSASSTEVEENNEGDVASSTQQEEPENTKEVSTTTEEYEDEINAIIEGSEVIEEGSVNVSDETATHTSATTTND